MNSHMMAWLHRNGALAGILIVIAVIGVVIGSMLFMPPDHMEGTVIEKIYVPSTVQSSGTPYSGTRRGAYSVTSVKEEQWIAVVLTDKGDTLTVHCHPDHYGNKQVGDHIHFREYEGSLLHIKYFAHGEEE